MRPTTHRKESNREAQEKTEDRGGDESLCGNGLEIGRKTKDGQRKKRKKRQGGRREKST